MLWFWLLFFFAGCFDKSTDADGDGYFASEDCDDNNPDAYPGGIEVCDGADNDCNGEVDGDNATDAQAWYLDRDGDGHPSEMVPDYACTQPDNTFIYFDDCDDTDETVSGAPENM